MTSLSTKFTLKRHEFKLQNNNKQAKQNNNKNNKKRTKNLQKNYTILIKFTVLCWAILSEFGRPQVLYA